jgi:hypothetical protein
VTDPHSPATSPGTTEAGVERRAAIAAALGKEVWPADRDALLATAQENDADDRVLSDLRRLAGDGRFQNVQEVARALGIGTEQERF